VTIDVDVLAKALRRCGNAGKGLPRGAFESDGHRYPLIVGNGQQAGQLIPGHGLVLDSDLKTLGITRAIPNVIERTPWMRLMERLADDSGAITSLADLLAAPRTSWMKTDSFAALSNGLVRQQFEAVASPVTFAGVGNVAPTARSIAGAYNDVLADPAPGLKKYLIGASLMTTTSPNFAFGAYVDVLSVFGNIPMDTAAPATISFTTAPLTRCISGVGVYAFLSASVAGFSYGGSPVYTVSYTNQAGTSGQSSVVPGVGDVFASESLYADPSDVTDYFAMPMQAGDYGVRAIASLSYDLASNVVGAVAGGFLYRPLLFFYGSTELGVVIERDMRAEPEILVDMPLDASGALGYHTMIWREAGTAAAFTASFMFTACEG
jgi:hypothetical protein